MARRFSLREFQQNVLDRMQQKQTAGGHVSTLGVQVDKGYWLVEMGDISEVLPMPPLTEVPLTRSWYCGVSNIRGNLYSISDLAAFMGGAETMREAQNRVLLVNPKFAFNAGLLVTRVLGLRDAANWQHEETAAGISYQDEQGQAWHKLDIGKLLQQPEFLQIGT
ncbi:MAG: chemotaxis protein CheW [Sideroxydans sp.]|nr:chemotaxis protein CheW [Sideroxydans sp.]